ncbi:alpha/beta hydrolase [Parvibaculum sp.]|uniref:alpha/beta fold hydrolase n=1 Tax=Parvibaculum sp. TaxID=2024848 RepID=UPI001B09DA59|nr:alpha/beta hydrolase [Parvibaculum sp.]MBO6678143.1 alpha/beta hydrolase [Parvibaculum sp.]MBO6683709.1 alpha/beta hydrolase [Parvibaculum sp.]MBO6904753.1 alpha/beta hydrolase [Parvibaculum sp.]
MTSVVRETPARRSLPLPEGTMSYLEWGADDPGKTPLHFAHANGFNGFTYRRILSGLADQFHVRAWDARGHGETTLTADPARHHNWYVYRDDLIAMAEDFKQATGKKIILAGHSMGGAASVMAAAARPDLVRGLALFDPVMIPTGARYAMLLSGLLGIKGNPLANGASRRRAVFPDRQTMVERYTGRGAFTTWPREFVEDYVEGGTKLREDGQVALSCAPAWEAANFRAQGHNITTAVRNLHVPFALVRAERGSTCRPPFPMLLKRRDPAAHVMQVPGSTHFLPMEFPDIVAKEIRNFAARLDREGR